LKENNLKQLVKLGQSIWLDYIRKDLITDGELQRLISEDGLTGITSNPSIFEKAIAHSSLYDDDIKNMAFEGKESLSIYEAISQHDVQSAAKEFISVYKETNGKEGYVSLEVNPHLAHDTQRTIAEAKRLWKSLNSTNVLIKVPATKEGIPVIQQLIGDGINVNVTLLFGLQRYQQVAEAYIAGLEELHNKGQPINKISSVASFFVSRIDALVDPMLDNIIERGEDTKPLVKKIRGQIAISSARAAYQIYKDVFSSKRFKKLSEHGAKPQRLLWASTGTKDPNYSDVKYVEALIGLETINTLPVKTLEAYLNHGDPKSRIECDPEGNKQIFLDLKTLGINLRDVTQQLEDEGVEKFNQSFDSLIKSIEQKHQVV